MGWKGTVRSINSTLNAIERDARRRQRELEKQEKIFAKMEELEQAAYEVEVYENYIDRITSIHKTTPTQIDWQTLALASQPTAPKKSNDAEEAARISLASYKPNFLSRTFGTYEKKRKKLEVAVELASQKDDERYRKATADFENELEDWKKQTELAQSVLSGNPDAFVTAVRELNTLSEIEELGSQLNFSVTEDGNASCTIKVHSKSIVPEQSKSLLKSGKLSEKNIPKGKFYEIYQDYVCGVVLRIANELLAILPLESVAVTATDELLDSKTGHLSEQPILSVLVPKETIQKLNLDLIDPSDSMDNFLHHMSFKKTQGFSAVKEIQHL